MNETAIQVGAWTQYRTELTKEELSIFTAAFKDFVGVDYQAVAIATQLVNGTNYSFFCNARGVSPHATDVPAMVEIYLEPNSLPIITNVRICER